MDVSEISKNLMNQVLGTGLLTIEDIVALSAGDLSSVQKLIPLFQQDEGFKQMMAERQTDSAKSDGAEQPAETTNGHVQAAPVRKQPGPPVFPGVASEFAVRLGRMLSHETLGRQIQINMQINTRGVTFQAVRFVQDEEGRIEAEPFLNPVSSPHGKLGDWLVQALQESVARLQAEAQDAQLLDTENDGEGSEGGEEEEEEVQEAPRRRPGPPRNVGRR